MARIVNLNSMNEFVNLTYSQLDQQTLQYFQNNYQNVFQTTQSDLLSNQFNSFLSQEATNKRIALQEALAHNSIDINYSDIQILDYNSIYTANSVMREVIMAHPMMREYYQNDMISGWDGNFYQEPSYPSYTPIYDEIMDGIEREDGTTVFICSDDDERFTLADKYKILQTWENAIAAVEDLDIDPTEE